MRTVCPIVYVIDDDDIALWMFRELLTDIGADIRTFTSAQSFLEAYHPGPHECLVCDLRMPEIGGLEVQRQLLEKGCHLPIILVSGYPEVHSAVEAIKKGAVDFLEKPVDGKLLVDKVQSALVRSRQLYAEDMRRTAREERLSSLTPKERQIAELVIVGRSSPKIAEDLDISVRTVENHRARLMEKLDVASAVELVRLFL